MRSKHFKAVFTAILYSLEPRPLPFPQRWIYCITVTEKGRVWVRDYFYHNYYVGKILIGTRDVIVKVIYYTDYWQWIKI